MTLIGNEITFDFGQATAADLKDYNRAFTKNDMPGMAKLMAKYATAAPPEWGDPKDPNTYLDGSYLMVGKPAIKAFFDAVTSGGQVLRDEEIVFDVYAITGRDFGEITTVRTTDFVKQAEILTRYTQGVDHEFKNFPKKFDVKNADDYLALPLATFRAAWIKFVEDVNSKN